VVDDNYHGRLTNVVQKYSLSSDTLFGFGKTTLKPEGEAKLDGLIAKLIQIHIASTSYVGHADRIGSSTANQQLSLSRAQSVKAYMSSKGVQSDHATVSGKGETQPISTVDACQGRVSEAVIACLQPDRRVDIEVVGQAK
jgi:OOP family OmpA-OmpF porin